MAAQFYVTELDSRPITGQGWYTSKAKAIRAARKSAQESTEPVWVAAANEREVVFRIATSDHPDAEFADEIAEVTR